MFGDICNGIQGARRHTTHMNNFEMEILGWLAAWLEESSVTICQLKGSERKAELYMYVGDCLLAHLPCSPLLLPGYKIMFVVFWLNDDSNGNNHLYSTRYRKHQMEHLTTLHYNYNSWLTG